MKQCLICDRFLKNQQEEYKKNHYLCGSNCTILYIQSIDWHKGKVDINVLNDIRKYTAGVGELMQYEIDKRIDKE